MKLFCLALIFTMALAVVSCDNGNLNLDIIPEQDYSTFGDGTLTCQEERDLLSQIYNTIYEFGTSKPCNDGSDWKYTAIGTKACGGPITYIPYSKEIDEEAFLTEVERYTAEEDALNKRCGAISDCSIEPEPSGINCVDGAPELEY